MELRYDVTVVGQQQIRAVLRGIESEILATNRSTLAKIRATNGAATRPRATNGAATRPRALGAGSATNEVKALTRVRISEEEKVSRAKERLHERFVAFETREIERITRVRLAALDKERAARTRLADSMSRGIGTTAKNTARTVATGATVVGGLLIGHALHNGMQTETGAARVANQGMRPDLAPAIAHQAYNIRGQTSEATINALDQFTQKSGDVEGGMAALPMLGQLAAATSTDFGDLGKAAGIANRLIADSVKDPIERLKQLKDVMTVLAVQGNMESVEMRDLAPNLGKLSAASRKFGGDPVKMLEQVGAIGQLAVSRGGATDAAEETTSVSRALDDIIKDASGKKGRKNKGFDPFTNSSHTKLKDLPTIFSDIMDSTGGDLGKLNALFGPRGARAISGVSSVYLDAANAAEKKKPGSGKAAGRAAVLGEIDKLAGAHKDMGAAADLVGNTAASKYIDAMNKFDEAISEKLLPAVTELIPQFVKLVPAAGYLADKLAWLVGELSKNPLEGIGLLILGKVSADIALAGIGKGIGFLLTGIIRSAIPGATGGIVAPALGMVAVPTARALTSGVSWGANALGVGGAATGATLGGAALLALGGIALAGWQGKKLYNETAGFSDFGGDVGKANTPEQYDAMMKQAGVNPGGSGGGAAAADQQAAAKMQLEAAKAMGEAARLLASAKGIDPARTKPIVAR